MGWSIFPQAISNKFLPYRAAATAAVSIYLGGFMISDSPCSGGGTGEHILLPIEEILYKGIIEEIGRKCMVCEYEEYFSDTE
jgi:hypothetical protein